MLLESDEEHTWPPNITGKYCFLVLFLILFLTDSLLLCIYRVMCVFWITVAQPIALGTNKVLLDLTWTHTRLTIRSYILLLPIKPLNTYVFRNWFLLCPLQTPWSHHSFKSVWPAARSYCLNSKWLRNGHRCHCILSKPLKMSGPSNRTNVKIILQYESWCLIVPDVLNPRADRKKSVWASLQLWFQCCRSALYMYICIWDFMSQGVAVECDAKPNSWGGNEVSDVVGAGSGSVRTCEKADYQSHNHHDGWVVSTVPHVGQRVQRLHTCRPEERMKEKKETNLY